MARSFLSSSALCRSQPGARSGVPAARLSVALRLLLTIVTTYSAFARVLGSGAADGACPRVELYANGPRLAVVNIQHTFNCSEETFWSKIFFNESFNERLYKDVLKFPEFSQRTTDETATELRRVLNVTPRIPDLPTAVKKIAGDNMGYAEEGVFDKTARRFRMNVKPSTLGDKLSIRGEVWVEPAGEGKIVRRFKADVTCKVFGIGGMIEKIIVSELEKSWNTAATFTNEYIAQNNLT